MKQQILMRTFKVIDLYIKSRGQELLANLALCVLLGYIDMQRFITGRMFESIITLNAC